jgi:hypothetical protein
MKLWSIAPLCVLIATSLVPSLPAAALATTPAPPPSACTKALTAVADEGSLGRRDDGPPYSAEQIRAFLPTAETAFKAAADGLCASGAIDRNQLAKYHRLLVRSGSGAVDSLIYEDEEALGSDTIVFEWVFSEEGLKVPEKTDIEAALRCWNHWEDAVCNERLP